MRLPFQRRPEPEPTSTRCADYADEGCAGCPINQLELVPEQQRPVWRGVVDASVKYVDNRGVDAFRTPYWLQLAINAPDANAEVSAAADCFLRQVGEAALSSPE